MYNTLSQAAALLFTLYLKTKGIDPEDHPFKKEEGRLKQYKKKVRKLAAELEINESNRTLEVDVAAMSRFIAAAVPDFSSQQKKELKKIGEEGDSKKKDRKKRHDRGEDKEAKAVGDSSKKVKKSTRGGSVGHKDAALNFLHDALSDVKHSE
jgi:exosome complex protein LRP1